MYIHDPALTACDCSVSLVAFVNHDRCSFLARGALIFRSVLILLLPFVCLRVPVVKTINNSSKDVQVRDLQMIDK